jgi:hypothetical protein
MFRFKFEKDYKSKFFNSEKLSVPFNSDYVVPFGFPMRKFE